MSGSQAQCVGDLCLALLIEHLDLETLEAGSVVAIWFNQFESNVEL